MSRLVLIDGHAILHRAYHAFPPSLRTRKGEPVNAVYGFTRMLLTVIEELQPEYLAVAFDLPGENFRHQEYLGYQSKRPKTDQELRDQEGRVYEVVEALNIPIFTAEGFEADDVIGTLTKQARTEVIVVTGDRDLMQLINPKVRIFAPGRGFAEGEFFSEKEVMRTLGVKPSQIIDYKALVGDSSDNYPGVPGVGPKTAIKLLEEFADLDTIYNSLDKIDPKIAEKLKTNKELAYLSRKLATIITKVPVKLKLKACRVKDYDQQKAINLFQELEFRSLINKLPGVEEKLESKQLKLV